ncbi:aldo/keto reductase [Botrimarina hoheduenensis]|nr:aldo/keto reductase [Botrimarina hoheduenensis]
MPAVGLGLWKIPPETTAETVRAAAANGYRLFDSACDYGNERQAGQGIKAALAEGIRRDELWITSKLWNTYHRPEHVRPALERTLADLGLQQLDLYLIHFPIALRYVDPALRYPPGWFDDPAAKSPAMAPDRVPLADTWGAMEALVEAGLTRRIGVCNYNIALLRDLLASARIRPSALQVEMHPRLAQPKLLRFCHEEGIACTAFSPLGAQSYFQLGMADPQESLLKHPAVNSVATAQGRSAAQVLLRWGVQRGAAVIPKTTRHERLSENRELFDFALTAEEMATLDGLDEHRRFNDPGVFCEEAFNTFFPIYE